MIEFNSQNIKMWSRLGSCGAFGAAMMSCAEEYEELAVLTADLCFYSGLTRFSQSYPDKIYNVGIAEQNLIGVASGMASEGFNVFAATYATFAAARCLDQVRVNMGYMNLPVKLVGLTAGLSVGILGSTHTGNEDIAAIRAIPGITVLSPADTTETVKALIAAAGMDSPVYIRLGGIAGSQVVYKEDYDYQVGKSISLRCGKDIAIIATGTMVAFALEVAKCLDQYDISVTVIDMHTIKPLDREAVLKCLNNRLIVTMEEHSIIGGLGSAISESIADIVHKPPHLMIGLDDRYIHAGDYKWQLAEYGITVQNIVSTIYDKYKGLR